MPDQAVPQKAACVIVGAGITGSALAYELVRSGANELVVIDAGSVPRTGGATSHAPGLVFQHNDSAQLDRLAAWSKDLYRQLGTDAGPCFSPVGGLELARSEERVTDLHRRWAVARGHGLEAHLLAPSEAAALFPGLEPSAIRAALLFPDDGVAHAVDICAALLSAVIDAGGTVVERTRVLEVLRSAAGRVSGVRTSAGRIETDEVFVCAGAWGPALVASLGVVAPVYPFLLQVRSTGPVEALKAFRETRAHLPIVRHQGRRMYARQRADSLVYGAYSKKPMHGPVATARSVGPGEQLPSVVPFAEGDAPWVDEEVAALWPRLAASRDAERFHGVMTFTPDGFPLVGPVASIPGLWFGLSVWVTHAGGVGRLLARWSRSGQPGIDPSVLDPARFHPSTIGRDEGQRRAMDVYRTVYDIPHPHADCPGTAVRTGPFAAPQKRMAAVMRQRSGIEVPQWYASKERGRDDARWRRRGRAAREWSSHCAVEHLIARRVGGFVDLSSHDVLRLIGAEAEMLAPPTPAHGARLLVDGEDRAVVEFIPVPTGGGDALWLLPAGSLGPTRERLTQLLPHTVALRDETDAWGVLALTGPEVRRAIDEALEPRIGSGLPPSFDGVPCETTTTTLMGDDDVLLLVRPTSAPDLWDRVKRRLALVGGSAIGARAAESLRIERGRPRWGAELTTDVLIEDVRVRIAEEAGTASGRLLATLVMGADDLIPLGGEPVVCGDDVVGVVTSAERRYVVGDVMAFAFVDAPVHADDARVDVFVDGERRSAAVATHDIAEPLLTRVATLTAERGVRWTT